MMISNAISQHTSSCEHYGYLMDCLMATLSLLFVYVQPFFLQMGSLLHGEMLQGSC